MNDPHHELMRLRGEAINAYAWIEASLCGLWRPHRTAEPSVEAEDAWRVGGAQELSHGVLSIRARR